MPTPVVGGDIKYGWKKGETWGTPVAVGADDGYKFKPDSLKKSRGSEVPEEVGDSYPTESIQGEIKVEGEFTQLLRFGTVDFFLSMIMGDCSVYNQEATLLHSGTSIAGTTTTVQDDTGGWTTDEYADKIVVFRTGTGLYQRSIIASNTADTLTFAAVGTAIGVGTFEICEYGPADLGIATSSTTASLDDSAKAWNATGSGEWEGDYVTIVAGKGIGETRKITSNDENTLNWTGSLTLDGTSKYEISGDTSRKVYTFADNTNGLFATSVKKLGTVAIHEVPSVKFTSMTIKNDVGKVPEFSFKTIGDRLNTSSVVNTQTTYGNVTILDDENFAVFKGEDSNGIGVHIRMRDAGSTALTSTDDISFKSIEFSYDPSYQGEYLMTGGDMTDEPTRTKIEPAKMKGVFPRFTSVQAAYWDEWDSNTAKMMELMYTGALISNVNRSIKIEFPKANYANLEAPTTTGNMPINADFELLKVKTANAGMPGVTGMFQITVVNQFGANHTLIGN